MPETLDRLAEAFGILGQITGDHLRPTFQEKGLGRQANGLHFIAGSFKRRLAEIKNFLLLAGPFLQADIWGYKNM